jgi:hypothetical protein
MSPVPRRQMLVASAAIVMHMNQANVLAQFTHDTTRDRRSDSRARYQDRHQHRPNAWLTISTGGRWFEQTKDAATYFRERSLSQLLTACGNLV